MNANRIRRCYSLFVSAGLAIVSAVLWITGSDTTRDGLKLVALALCGFAWMLLMDKVDQAIRRRAERDWDDGRAS